MWLRRTAGMRGEGRADDALRGLHTWVWEAEEMLDVVEWIRGWNAEHVRKVRFEGFDITAWSAVRALTAYLKKVDPGVGANFEEAIHPLDQPSSDASYPSLDVAVKQATRAALDHVQGRLEERKRAAWSAQASEPGTSRCASSRWRGRTLTAVWGTSATDVWAVGRAGTVVHVTR